MHFFTSGDALVPYCSSILATDSNLDMIQVWTLGFALLHGMERQNLSRSL